MVFYDWEWHYCPGVKRAVREAGLAVIESAPYQCFSFFPQAGPHGVGLLGTAPVPTAEGQGTGCADAATRRAPE